MPERNHEVIIDGRVFPDTVTVTLANDEFIDSCDYVSRELYESVCAANRGWQAENAKLRGAGLPPLLRQAARRDIHIGQRRGAGLRRAYGGGRAEMGGRMTLELEVDVDYLTDGGIEGMPTWVKLNDEDRGHPSTVYVNSSSYWSVVGENAKLREEVEQWHRLTAGIELPDYPITEFKPKDLEHENAKLRDLVRDMLPFAEVGMDDTCVARRCCLFEQCECAVGVKCAIEQHMLDRMRELEVEVDE